MSPIKPSFKSEFWPIFLIISGFILGAYFYSNFPEQVPSHWDINGYVDDWSARSFAAWFFPLLLLIFYTILHIVPYLDPKRDRYPHFKNTYHAVKNSLMTFLFAVYIATGIIGLGYAVPMQQVMPILVGLLFAGLGRYIGSFEQNWFAGVRNPWTLSNPEVWKKTNILMSRLITLAGVLIIFTALPLPVALRYSIYIVAILGMILIPNIYSYLLFQKENEGKKK